MTIVGENIIGALNLQIVMMLYNYYFSNIVTVILHFSLLIHVNLLLLIFFVHFWYNFFASFLYLPFYSYHSFSYRNSDSCRSFSLLKAIVISFPLLFVISLKTKKWKGWKCHSNREKSNIDIAILEKCANWHHFAFWGTNNIFVDSRWPEILK